MDKLLFSCVVLLGVLVMAPSSYGLSCLPCQEEHCRLPAPINRWCTLVKDNCGCCPVYAKSLMMPCVPEYNQCREHLVCRPVRQRGEWAYKCARPIKVSLPDDATDCRKTCNPASCKVPRARARCEPKKDMCGCCTVWAKSRFQDCFPADYWGHEECRSPFVCRGPVRGNDFDFKCRRKLPSTFGELSPNPFEIAK